MNAKVGTVVVGLLLAVSVCLYFAFRTVPEDGTSITEYLPTGVTNVADHGNNWFTFEWNGRLFLYHRERAGYHLGEAITELQR